MTIAFSIRGERFTLIISLNQTRSDIRFAYEFMYKNNVICKSYIPIKIIGFEIIFQQDDEDKYRIEASSGADLKKIFNINSKVRKSYFIKNSEDNIVGYILIKRSSYWNGYLYYEIMFNKELYTAYEVGKGKEGLFLPIYKSEAQSALIEKAVAVCDNKDTYKIYLQEEKDAIPIMLFNVIYDTIRWANAGEYTYKKKMYNYIYTFKKDLLSKYDPRFVENIIE
jgi:hypothetical protein